MNAIIFEYTRWISMKRTSLMILALSLFVTLSVHAQKVTFSVNMEHAGLEPGDEVAVRGNIPELGNWSEDGQLILSAGKEDIYEGTLQMPVSDKKAAPVLYKYVILRQSGEVEWESRGNRTLEPKNMPTVWFDDRSSPGIQQTVMQVTFRLDLVGHKIDRLPPEGVALMGGRAPLSFDLEAGRREMTEVSEGIWETTVDFPYGTPHDVPFMFAWKHLDTWQWEYKIGDTRHVLWINDSTASQTVYLTYDVRKPGVVPVGESSRAVDQYAEVVSALGEAGPHSEYMYGKAIEELMSGNLTTAEETYTRYREAHPGDEEKTEFWYRMASAISELQGVDQALEYIKRRLKEEKTSEQMQLYSEFLKGKLNMDAGRQAVAMKHFNKVITNKTSGVAGQYSRIAMEQIHARTGETDSLRQSLAVTELQRGRKSSAQKRSEYKKLAHYYRQAGMKDKVEELLVEQSVNGTPGEQLMGTLELAEFYTGNDREKEALELLNQIDEAQLRKGMEPIYRRQQLKAHYQLEHYQVVAALFEQYQQAWPDDPYIKTLAVLDKNARRELEESGDMLDLRPIPTTADSTRN